MKSRHLHVVPRFPRTLDDAFKGPSYGRAVEGPYPKRRARPYVAWLVFSALAGVALVLIAGRG